MKNTKTMKKQAQMLPFTVGQVFIHRGHALQVVSVHGMICVAEAHDGRTCAFTEGMVRKEPDAFKPKP